MLFVAPSMIGLIVGVVASVLLLSTFLPQRH
jgi:hypothetical protein